MYRRIGLAKEVESPENPGTLEKRVALIPNDVKTLVDHGLYVEVETGAGSRVQFSDKEYEEAGATIVDHKTLYNEKDLVIKFKGPAMESIPLMRNKTTLFCMAHFNSFPERAQLLQKHQINVIAMEEVLPAFE